MDGTDVDEAAEYISNNYFDPTKLVWEDENGTPKIALESDQLALIHSIDQNLFYDDGTGYLDLGLDNIYSYDDDGKIVADVDRTWISINGQPVAYYHLDTVENGDDYTITGRVPAIINGTRVNLILVFDNENPKGYIAGYQVDYREGETDAVAKIETDLLNETDGSKVKVTFICDYYSYDMEYQDSYVIGYAELDGVTDVISNTDVGEGKVKIAYLFTDIYNQKYWTPTLSR